MGRKNQDIDLDNLICYSVDKRSSKMSGLAAVVKAADFAARKHKDQRRKAADQLPYINHPIGVAHILMSEGGIDDPIVIQAALLHDTVEDTETTLDEIEEHFGQTVKSCR